MHGPKPLSLVFFNHPHRVNLKQWLTVLLLPYFCLYIPITTTSICALFTASIHIVFFTSQSEVYLCWFMCRLPIQLLFYHSHIHKNISLHTYFTKNNFFLYLQCIIKHWTLDKTQIHAIHALSEVEKGIEFWTTTVVCGEDAPVELVYSVSGPHLFVCVRAVVLDALRHSWLEITND